MKFAVGKYATYRLCTIQVRPDRYTVAIELDKTMALIGLTLKMGHMTTVSQFAAIMRYGALRLDDADKRQWLGVPLGHIPVLHLDHREFYDLRFPGTNRGTLTLTPGWRLTVEFHDNTPSCKWSDCFVGKTDLEIYGVVDFMTVTRK